MNGWVYYCDDDRGRIKIGYSRNVAGRISEFKTLNPEIELLAQECGEYDTERLRQNQFHSEWIGGEWFLKSDRLVEWIGLVAAFDTLSLRIPYKTPTHSPARRAYGWIKASGAKRAIDFFPKINQE